MDRARTRQAAEALAQLCHHRRQLVALGGQPRLIQLDIGRQPLGPCAAARPAPPWFTDPGNQASRDELREAGQALRPAAVRPVRGPCNVCPVPAVSAFMSLGRTSDVMPLRSSLYSLTPAWGKKLGDMGWLLALWSGPERLSRGSAK